MIAVIQLLLPLILQLIGFFLDQHKEANEARQAYIKFLEALQKGPINSASAKKSIEAQKARLNQTGPK